MGPLNDLVVHVGEILHVIHLVAQVFQIPAQNVEGNVTQGVANVGGGIGSDPADVHLDGLAVGGNELFCDAGEGVI